MTRHDRGKRREQVRDLTRQDGRPDGMKAPSSDDPDGRLAFPLMTLQPAEGEGNRLVGGQPVQIEGRVE